jgi:hypothetical protein
MGTYWCSYAEVVSTEPEVIKQLIKKAKTKDDIEFPSIYDLTIDGNSVLFNSGGYGCYGTDFEDGGGFRKMLFEFLFENYDRALVCFEVVETFQQTQRYHFTANWAKPDGKVDWDDESTFGIHRRVYFEDKDKDEGEFDMAEFWFLTLPIPSYMPDLEKLVGLAQEKGFTDWATDPYDSDSEPGILVETIWKICNYLEAELEKYDEDLGSNACDEIQDYFLWLASEIEIDNVLDNAEFELPDDFLKLISPRKIWDSVATSKYQWNNFHLAESFLDGRLLFSKFKEQERQKLYQLLCSVFNTNSTELEKLYHDIDITFEQPGYPLHFTDRSFFKSADETFRSTYQNSPVIALDLPSLMEFDDERKDKPTIAIIGQDPKHDSDHEQLVIGIPYGLHHKDSREKLKRTKLYFDMVKFLLRSGYRVYLTDLVKIWVCNPAQRYSGIKLPDVDRKRFLELIKPELAIVKPSVVITWGKVADNVVDQLSLDIKHLNFPHPSGAANDAWAKLIDESPTYSNKLEYWQTKIRQELMVWNEF